MFWIKYVWLINYIMDFIFFLDIMEPSCHSMYGGWRGCCHLLCLLVGHLAMRQCLEFINWWWSVLARSDTPQGQHLSLNRAPELHWSLVCSGRRYRGQWLPLVQSRNSGRGNEKKVRSWVRRDVVSRCWKWKSLDILVYKYQHEWLVRKKYCKGFWKEAKSMWLSEVW